MADTQQSTIVPRDERVNQRPWWTVAALGGWSLLVVVFIWWMVSAAPLESGAVIRYDGLAGKPLGVLLREWLVLAWFNFHWAIGWILLSPYVLWLASRFHLEKNSWWWRLPLLLLVGISFVIGCDWLSRRFGVGKDVLIVFTAKSVVEEKPGVPDLAKVDGDKGTRITSIVSVTNLPPGASVEKLVKETEDRVVTNDPLLHRALEEAERNFIPGRTIGMRSNDMQFTQRLLPERERRAPVFYAMDSAAYLALLGLAHAFYFHRRYQERERQAGLLAAHLTEARLRSLRNQLQPHFLFNALNGIATLVRRDQDAAHEMLISLSELLRLALSQADRQEITLAEELDFLERYLEIQRMRFGDRLSVKREIDPEVLSFRVPPLLLQPLVENAIRHGLEPLGGPGWVKIGARRQDGSLLLSVEDNGVGMAASEREASGKRQGLGLTSIRERLNSIYGERASLDIRPGMNAGVLVQIQLPLPTDISAQEAAGHSNS